MPCAISQRPAIASASRAPFSRLAAAARSRSQPKPWISRASGLVLPSAAKSSSARLIVSLPTISRPASKASPRARSPMTWSRGTATSRSGWRPAPNSRPSSDGRGELADDVVAHLSAPQRLDIGGIMIGSAAERRGPGDEHGGARADHRRGIAGIDPAIDLDVDRQAALATMLAIASIFLSWLVMNFCPPNPGLTLITSTRSISSMT